MLALIYPFATTEEGKMLLLEEKEWKVDDFD